jgi:hypothetical protein
MKGMKKMRSVASVAIALCMILSLALPASVLVAEKTPAMALSPLSDVPAFEDAASIVAGASVTGEIALADAEITVDGESFGRGKVYCTELDEGTPYIANLTGEAISAELGANFDSCLYLFSESGDLLAANNDYLYSPTSRIGYIPEETGTYYFICTSLSGEDEGRFALSIGGGHIISGAVTNEDNDPLAGIDVNLLAMAASPAAWTAAAKAVTADDGSYAVAVAPGTYRAGFNDDNGEYFSSYYAGASVTGDVDTASDITVISSDCGGIDAVLSRTGGISGTVTSEGDADISETEVVVYADSSDGWIEETSDFVDGQGAWLIGGLQPGGYRIGFKDNDGLHSDEYYDDKENVDEADTVTVTAGEVTGEIDAVLSLAISGSISGMVTSSAGALLQGISVTAIRYDEGESTEETVTGTTTMADGTYTLENIPVGAYFVRYEDASGAFAKSYYNDADIIDDAQEVPVLSGTDTPNIDAIMKDAPDTGDPHMTPPAITGAAIIKGAVTDKEGSPLLGIGVAAQFYNEGFLEYAAISETDDEGDYALEELAPGRDYYIYFEDYEGDHRSVWYGGSTDTDGATPVYAEEDAVIEEISISLAAIGSIEGTVLSQTGAGISGVSVSALRYDDASGNHIAVASRASGSGGSYLIGDLDIGEYILKFDDPQGSWLTAYYDGASGAETTEEAISVTVSKGTVTGSIATALYPAPITN